MPVEQRTGLVPEDPLGREVHRQDVTVLADGQDAVLDVVDDGLQSLVTKGSVVGTVLVETAFEFADVDVERIDTLLE